MKLREQAFYLSRNLPNGGGGPETKLFRSQTTNDLDEVTLHLNLSPLQSPRVRGLSLLVTLLNPQCTNMSYPQSERNSCERHPVLLHLIASFSSFPSVGVRRRTSDSNAELMRKQLNIVEVLPSLSLYFDSSTDNSQSDP